MKKILLILSLVCIVLVSGCNSAPSTKDLKAVSPFSLEKFMGNWYEIARLPHYFEQGMTKVKAEYILQENGKVKVINSGIKEGKPKRIEGVAKFKGNSDVGELKVSFFWPFYGAYRIIDLDPEYSIVVVTSSTRDYLWLLSRNPVIEPLLLESYLKKIEDFGFDKEKLIFPNGNTPSR